MKLISNRDTALYEIENMLKGNGYPVNKTMIEGVADIVNKIADYHEEGVKLYPIIWLLISMGILLLGRSCDLNLDEMSDQEVAVWYNDNVIYPDKVRLNLYYLDHYSFVKDIQMIVCTVLLKQMIYREKQETLPNSRFRRVQFLSSCSLWWKAVWAVACVIAFAIAFEPTFLIIDTLYDFFNLGKWNIWVDALSVLFLLGTLLCVTAYVVRTYGRSKLNKLNIADGEIELKDEGSVLSEHLAEILYFFQETEYDVVIFEDLDRFENKKIFLKLRELNYILNKSK